MRRGLLLLLGAVALAGCVRNDPALKDEGEYSSSGWLVLTMEEDGREKAVSTAIISDETRWNELIWDFPWPFLLRVSRSSSRIGQSIAPTVRMKSGDITLLLTDKNGSNWLDQLSRNGIVGRHSHCPYGHRKNAKNGAVEPELSPYFLLSDGKGNAVRAIDVSELPEGVGLVSLCVNDKPTGEILETRNSVWQKFMHEIVPSGEYPLNIGPASFFQGDRIGPDTMSDAEAKAFQDDVLARISAKCAAPKDPHLIAACARQKEAQNWKQF